MSQALDITSAKQTDIHAHRVLILDFGGQYTQLIARRVRECGVFSEIHPWDMNEAAIREFAPAGVILSGGPESVNLPAVEPDLPVEVAVIPDGPLWVTGGIDITGSDGTPLERRNRVTLCRCGQSSSKPLCDGSHKEAGFSG